MLTKQQTPPPSLSFYLLLISIILHTVAASAAAGICTEDATCGPGEPPIRFPFRLRSRGQRRGQPRACGFPRFGLSCNAANQTLLELRGGGKFSVKGIDYAEQEIWLNDPGGCLPARLLSLNLSGDGSPFTGLFYEKFTFFNCSSRDYLRYRLNPIACLSGDIFTTFATSSARIVAVLSAEPTCRTIGKVAVPVQWPFFQEVQSSDLGDDLRLTWAEPPCGECEARGGRCGFKTDSSREIICSKGRPSRGLPRSATYALIIGIGVPSLLCLLGLFCFLCSRIKSYGRSASLEAEATSTISLAAVAGLDRPTIASYPKIVLGESRRLPKPDDNMCAICLSEYQPKETLKTIPECQHCFHANCIDEWLHINATCPVCRHSPEPVQTYKPE